MSTFCDFVPDDPSCGGAPEPSFCDLVPYDPSCYDHERFEAAMEVHMPDYTWEVITVTTSDSYMLSLYHIYFEETLDASLGPVLFQHADGMDASLYVEAASDPMIQMVELGHHIYVGNNRGTQYSQGHISLDPETDQAEYWDFTWYNMAEDVLANVEAMYNDAGTGKGWYFGYSQGAKQMIVALTKYETELTQWLHRSILIAPCTIEGDSDETNDNWYTRAMVSLERENGVYAYLGPTWDTDIEVLCDIVGWSECYQLRSLDPLSVASTSFKNFEHVEQNQMTLRFQEFVENNFMDEYEAELIPVENITTMPVSLIIAENDNVCTAARAYELAETLGKVQNVATFTGFGHWTFEQQGPTYATTLLNELTDAVIDEPYYTTIDATDEVTIGATTLSAAIGASFLSMLALF